MNKLNTDIKSYLNGYLNDSDFVNFSTACKKDREQKQTHERVEKILKENFEEKFGTYCQCEKNIPIENLGFQKKGIQALIEKHEDLLHEEAYIKKNRNNIGILTFDENGIPSLIDNFIGKSNTSWFGKIIDDYRLWRGTHLNIVSVNVNRIFYNNHAVEKEISESELDQDCPLKDKRDKCRRLQIIEKEKKFFEIALTSTSKNYYEFVQSLPYFERIAFWIISIFDSSSCHFYLTETTTYIMLQCPHCSLGWRKFNNEKVVKFGETTITFEGEEIPVVVEAKFGFNSYRDDFSGDIHFCVMDTYRNNVLGKVKFIRKYKDENGSYNSEDTISKNPILTRENGRFTLEFEDQLRRDELNGDCPIMRVLLQIAMEIFSYEPEVELDIENRFAKGFAYEAAGFRSYSDEKHNFLLEEIKKHRNNGKVLPPDRNLKSYHVWMYKMNDSGMGTKFVNKSQDGLISPALVDFELNAAPITWEEQIEKNRILKNHPGGPVLPQYIQRDLTKFIPDVRALYLN